MVSSETNERRPGLLMEVQYLLSTKRVDVNYVQLGESWMDPIFTYIKSGNLSSDPTKARKVQIRSSRFTILNDELSRGDSLNPT